MKIPKSEVINLLTSQDKYQEEVFKNVRLAIQNFYTRLNELNSDRQDFYIKQPIPSKGVPAEALTQKDFLGAFSRLMYGNNVCLALSFFKEELLIATNKDDYDIDVFLPNLTSNYNSVCKYVKWVADLSSKAQKPVWVEGKLAQCLQFHDYDGLAGNLAAAIGASPGIKKGQAQDTLSKVNKLISARGGEAKKIMQHLDETKPFKEAWFELVNTVENTYGTKSEEAKICEDFTRQYKLESKLQMFKLFAKNTLESFFNHKTTHYSGDLVSEWINYYNVSCPTEDKKIYKDSKNVIRDFLRDLLILDSFTSRHCDDKLIGLIKGIVVKPQDSSSSSDDALGITPGVPQIIAEYEKSFKKVPETKYLKVKIIDDEGEEISDIESVFPGMSQASVKSLEIDGIRMGDVHSEMRILQYQLKHGGLSSYTAISKLCCAICHIIFDSLEQGSKDYYPGYHGKNYPIKLSNWMKQNSDFLEHFLGEKAFPFYKAVKDIEITLGSNIKVNAGELILLLIETMPKFGEELKGFIKLPEKLNIAESQDNSFLIDFGISDPHGLETKYYSCQEREFIDLADGKGFEVQLIQIQDHGAAIL